MLRVNDYVSVKVGDWDSIISITIEGSNTAISDIAEDFRRDVVLTLEEALEIIKTKRVDVFELLLSISNLVYRNPLERYNSYVEGSFNTKLTPQEFDLLEEVFATILTMSFSKKLILVKSNSPPKCFIVVAISINSFGKF